MASLSFLVSGVAPNDGPNLKYADLEDDKFYCFLMIYPPDIHLANDTLHESINSIMGCGICTTFPEIGTITKKFKECLDHSQWGRLYFNFLMEVYEGNCKAFSGMPEQPDKPECAVFKTRSLST